MGGPSILSIPLISYAFWFLVSVGIYTTYFVILHGDEGPRVSKIIIFLYIYEAFGFLLVEPRAIPIAVPAILLLLLMPYIISRQVVRPSVNNASK